MASARPMSSGRSPTTQDAVRSRLSAAAAALAMPGLGLRSSLVRAKASTTPRGDRGNTETGRCAPRARPGGLRCARCTRATSSMPVQPPRDPGLVRDHRDRDAGPVEPGDRLRRPFDELDPVDRPDVSVVDDDRAVAIEQDPWSRACLPRSGHRDPLAGQRGVQRILAGPAGIPRGAAVAVTITVPSLS